MGRATGNNPEAPLKRATGLVWSAATCRRFALVIALTRTYLGTFR